MFYYVQPAPWAQEGANVVWEVNLGLRTPLRKAATTCMHKVGSCEGTYSTQCYCNFTEYINTHTRILVWGKRGLSLASISNPDNLP